MRATTEFHASDLPRLHSVEEVLACLESRVDLTSAPPSLVLIGGYARSGKSTLAQALASRLSQRTLSVTVVCLDRWLVGVDQRVADSTVMDRYECAAITDAVRRIIRGDTVYPPVYDAASRRRVAERGVDGIRVTTGVLIVEGVIALALAPLLEMAQLRVFTEVDTDVRLARLREFYVDIKGLSPAEAAAVIEPREREEVPFVTRTMVQADVVFCP